MYKEYKPYRNFLIFADMLFTLAVFAIFVELRPHLYGREVEATDLTRMVFLYGVVLVLWAVLFGLTGVYELSAMHSFSRQWGKLTSSYLLGVFVFAGVLYFTYRDVSRLLVIYFSISNYFVLLLIRFIFTRYLRRVLKRAKRSNVLIAGAADNAVDLAHYIMAEHTSIFNLVGFADDDWDCREPLPVSVIGRIDEIPNLVRSQDIHIILVALPESRSRQIEHLLDDISPLPVRVFLLYDVGKIALLRSEVESFGSSLVIGLREPVIQGAQRLVKRTFDFTASLLMLIVLAPLLALIWIAIKIDSPGPAIFRAKRIGENGKLFEMLKFRSMVTDADKYWDQSIGTDKEGRPVFKLAHDPRITRVGAFLRKTSLDELPQLINVIKGEMSLVGPRPEQPFIAENYDRWERERLSVPPGVTGWWQVSGRSDLPLHLNVHLDLYYVRNYSLFLDLKILLKTVVVVLKGRGAY